MAIYTNIPAFPPGMSNVIYIARIAWDMCAGRAPRSLSYMAHINIFLPLVEVGYYMAVIIPSSGLSFHRIVATKT